MDKAQRILIEYLEKHGVSKSELGRRLGERQQRICDYITGRRPVPVGKAYMWHKFFKCEPHELNSKAVYLG